MLVSVVVKAVVTKEKERESRKEGTDEVKIKRGGAVGGRRTIGGEGDSAKGVDLPSVLSPIILSSRVSLTNVAQSSDPSAIHDDVQRGRPGDGRAATASADERRPPRLNHV